MYITAPMIQSLVFKSSHPTILYRVFVHLLHYSWWQKLLFFLYYPICVMLFCLPCWWYVLCLPYWWCILLFTLHCFKFPKTFRPWRCEPVPNGNWPKLSGFFYRHIPGHFRCQIVSVPKYFGDLFSMRKVYQAGVQPASSRTVRPRSYHWATQT